MVVSIRTKIAVLSLAAWLVLEAHALGAVRVLGSSVLGADPQTVNRLNGESFQQDVLTTFNGASGRDAAFASVTNDPARVPICGVLDAVEHQCVR